MNKKLKKINWGDRPITKKLTSKVEDSARNSKRINDIVEPKKNSVIYSTAKVENDDRSKLVYVQPGGQQRNSNLELLRIITMLLIIAHHMVVNSGVSELYDYSNISPNMVFLQLWGMWGKTGINIFVLISGYFMCTSKLTVSRFGKIYLEAKGYWIIIFMIFLAMGYESFSPSGLFKLLFANLYAIGMGFTPSFFMFYLFIPFYNLFINVLDKRKHVIILGLLLFYYCIVGTFFFNSTLFSEPVWYFVLYMLASFIRKYPSDWMTNNKLCGLLLTECVVLSWASVIVLDFIHKRFEISVDYYLVAESNRFLALVVSVFAFLFFNNLKIQSKWINLISRTTFGVFLIHTASDAMRKFLWIDILDIKGAFSAMSLGRLIIYAIGCVLGIFIVCSVIDMLRIKIIEKTLLNWFGKFKWWNRELW